MLVPAITIYAVLVWFLWGLFMGLGWALGTWIMGQLFEMPWSRGVHAALKCQPFEKAWWARKDSNLGPLIKRRRRMLMLQ